MLTDAEVKHIAKLARVELDHETEKKLQKELSSVLGYVEKLNEVKTDGIEPLYQVTGLTNSMRSDSHRGDFPSGELMHDVLVGQAPHKSGNQVKVKTILSHK